MDSSDFNYRKVAGKRKRNLGLVEDSLIESFTDIPMAKKPKLEPTATEWFHNYKPLSLNDSTTNIAPLSLPRKPLQSLPVNTTLNAARSAVKLQPKSLELLERTKKVPEITALKPTASTNKAKGRSKPRKKTRSDAPTKKKSIKTTKTTKTTRTREQELFPYEGLEIFKRIYVGGANVARDKELIDERKITAIVNATKELPNYFQDEEGFSYFKIPLQDSIDAQLIKYFDEAAEFMHEKLSGSSDNALLVHCQMGQSRSPSVIIAYAIKYMGWSLEKTWNHINDIHKDLKVNEGFKLQLMQYEKRVTGENSLDFYKKRATRKPVRYTATARSMR